RVSLPVEKRHESRPEKAQKHHPECTYAEQTAQPEHRSAQALPARGQREEGCDCRRAKEENSPGEKLRRREITCSGSVEPVTSQERRKAPEAPEHGGEQRRSHRLD